MSKPIANLDITIETSDDLIDRVNLLADAMTNEVITANGTYSNTGTPASQRHAQLFGSFTAYTLVANNVRGGNTSSGANLTFTSNVTFTSNLTFNGVSTFTSNASIGGATFVVTSNTSVTAANQQFKSNSSIVAFGISGNSSSTTVSVTGNTFNINTTSVVLGNTGISANGSVGSSGQVLQSNGSSAFWGSLANVGILAINTGSGLSGGPITSNGTIAVVANNGLKANTNGVFVVAGNNQLVSNSTGVFVDQTNIDHDSLTNYVSNKHVDHSAVTIAAGTGLSGGGTIAANRTLSVNSAYIATISSNNASYFNSQGPSYYTDIVGRLGYNPLNTAGDSMTGRLNLVAGSSGSASIRIPQGSAPSTPGNGDMWTTAIGLFARIAGSTKQMLTTDDVASFMTIDSMSIASDSGYIKFSVGIILQWGKVTLGQDSGSVVTLPQSYTTWHIPVVSATSVYGNAGVDQNTGLTNYNLSTLTIWNASDELHTIPWISIGV